jgi:DNA-binding protein HU-beta
MAVVGDRVSVQSKSGPRLGVVRTVSGTLVTVEWDTGGQTTVIPAPGVMSVISGGRKAGGAKAPAKKKTAATKKKATPAKKKATPAKKKSAAKKKAAPAKKKAATKKKR